MPDALSRPARAMIEQAIDAGFTEVVQLIVKEAFNRAVFQRAMSEPDWAFTESRVGLSMAWQTRERLLRLLDEICVWETP